MNPILLPRKLYFRGVSVLLAGYTQKYVVINVCVLNCLSDCFMNTLVIGQ